MERRSFRRRWTFFGGIVLLCMALILGVSAGAVSIPLGEMIDALRGRNDTEHYRIFYYLRVPRVLCAAMTGMNLAVAGCILQGVLRNPLADPGIIGVTAGAGFAAMAVMLIAPEWSSFVPLAAFSGGLLSAVAVFFLAFDHGIQPLRLILAGIALAAFFGGGSTALSVFYSDRFAGAISWLAGGFSRVSWQQAGMIFPYTAIGVVLAVGFSGRLKVLQFGDEVATALGVSVERMRFFGLSLAALLAASAVSVAGLLGFVGLIVPHMMRLLVGSDMEYVLPVSAIFGAALVVGADTAGRVLFAPVEVPVGIFLSFLGAPFFLYLLKRGGKRG